MFARNLIEAILVLVLLVILGLVGWQTAANMNSTVKLTDSVKEIAGQVGTLQQASKDGAAREDQLKKDLGEMQAQVAKVQSAAALAVSHDKRLDKVERDLQANLEAVDDQRKAIGQIAKRDNAGQSIVSIGEMARQSPQFKEEFRQAVRDAMPTSSPQPLGTVRIDNRMSSSQYIEVNGVGRWVAPRGVLEVAAPAGWATTRLPGYEGIKYWSLAAPDYFRQVIIDYQSF
jgi:hypothetical protein